LKLFQPGQAGETIQCEGPDGYVRELRHMVQAIQSGRPPSVVTAQEAVSALEICEAEEKSAHLRQLIRV